ncbi:MAG: TonB-dependent receptor plug domain-containing protein, partial [Proteobacteria bacterium]|nr:TonB-dependent receptor plug domain-containing protein [Pseudomonadota bacterium]
MNLWEKIKWIWMIVLLSLVLSQPAWAAEDDITVLDTVIVTESGTKNKLLDTNASISVLTQKDIKNSGQRKTAEIIASIPGVINQKAGAKTYYSIRGTRGSLTGGVVIYVDGRPINAGLSGYSKIDSIPVDNIEKIEVIKSPPTSQYGANAARGVILITTKTGKSADEPVHGYVSGEYGSWDTMKITAGISGAKEQYDYSLSAYNMTTDGYRDSEDETKSADGQIGYRFDGGRIDVIAGINDSFTLYPKGLPLWQVAKDRSAVGYNTQADGSGFDVLPSETDEELFNTGLKFKYEKNNWLVNSSLIFTRDNEVYTDMKDFNNPAVNSKRDDYRDDRQENQYDVKLSCGRTFFSSKADTSDTLTLGFDFKYADFEEERSYPFNTTALSAAMTTGKNKADIDASRQLLGINLNNDLTIDKFRLQAGLRRNEVEYKLENKVPA